MLNTQYDDTVVRRRSQDSFLVRFRTSDQHRGFLDACRRAGTVGNDVLIEAAVTFALDHPEREPARQLELLS